MQSGAQTLPTRLLVTGPAGSGKTFGALARIREAATRPGKRGRGAAPPEDALLILPTYAQVLHVKRMALSRWDVRGILDEPFKTFTSAGERFLAAFRVRSLPSADERDRLMQEALSRAGAFLFEPVAERPGFRARLLRLVKEVKQTGLPPEEASRRLAAGARHLNEASRARLEAFLEVFAAYETLLREARLEDHEDSLRRMLEALRTRPPERAPKLLVVDAFEDFTPVEERILTALVEAVTAAGGSAHITLGYDPERSALFHSSAGVRQRLLAAGFEEQRLAAFPRAPGTPLHAISQRLFGAVGEPEPGGAHVLEIVAGDAEDEADAVAREIRRIVLKPGLDELELVRGWRDVGVVVRRMDDVARYESAFERLGVPLRVVGAGRPLASHPLVRALRGPLQLLSGALEAGRFEAREITAYLRWRALTRGRADELGAVDDWEMEHRTRGFPISWEAYRSAAPDALRAWVDELESTRAACGRDDGDVYADLRAALEDWIVHPEPAGLDERGRPRDRAHDLRRTWAVAVAKKVLSVLDALRMAGQRTGFGADVRLPEAVHELTEAFERSSARLPDRRLDAVSLMSAEEARFWELPVVFVAGLEEGQFPIHPDEDVLLRDRDRERLAEDDGTLRLPLVREREAFERRLFYVAMTRAQRRLVLVRSGYDTNGDPISPSFFLRDLHRVVTATPLGTPRPPGKASVAFERCHTRPDLALSAATVIGARGSADEARRRARALLELLGPDVEARGRRRWRAEADRLSLDDDVRARFGASVDRVSASRLNNALQCRYRYFLAGVVGIPQDEASFEGPTFEARHEGTVMHEALRLAVAEPTLDVEEIVRRAIAHAPVTNVERVLLGLEVRRVIDLFRIRQQSLTSALGTDRRDVEFTFGYENDVWLGQGEGRFRLRGKIDRLDTADGLASVIDYKLSVSGANGGHKGALDGTDLQLPLYAKAVEQLRGVHVVGMEWVAIRTRMRRIVYDEAVEALFVDRREGQTLSPRADFASDLDACERIASDAVAAVRATDHTKAPGRAKECETCRWATICRPDLASLRAREAGS